MVITLIWVLEEAICTPTLGHGWKPSTPALAKKKKKNYRRQIEILLLNNRPHVRIMNLTMQMLLLLKYIEFLVTSKK